MEDHPLLKIFEERKNEVLKVAAEKSAPRGRSSLTWDLQTFPSPVVDVFKTLWEEI